MKTKWIAGVVLGLGLLAGPTWAADAEAGKGLTAEQQEQRGALVTKYDANLDGRLDEKEAKAMSRADKRALAKLGGIGTAKKSVKEEKAEAKEKAAKEKAEKAAKAAEAKKAAKDAAKAAPGGKSKK
jgi:colicin import membrane protein